MCYLLQEEMRSMLNKVAFKNAKRSIREYILYLLTMVIISSLMFAFNSMIFSEDILKLCSMAGVMAAFIGIASVFIVFVVAWLVHYMVRFMMEKKSKEFGTYLLLGMKKQEVAALFIKENAMVGLLGFLLGVIPGIFLQQVFTTIFFNLFDAEYIIKIEFSGASFGLTFVLYLGIYVMALIRNKRQFKKMTIKKMMTLDKENEQTSNQCEKLNLTSFFISIFYFIFFDVMLVMGKFRLETIFIFIALLVISIYLFYRGISSFIGAYLKSQRNGIYQKDHLFLLRQFSSKIKTMQFTMANITILFVFALIGCTISMMLKDYLDTSLDSQLPFDIIIYSDQVNAEFEDYLKIIEDETTVKEALRYHVYQNQSSDINSYLRRELSWIYDESSESDASEFFKYDTFMKLSDYNHLRKMLGYEEVTISEAGFLVQSKANTKPLLQSYFEEHSLQVAGEALSCEGYYTDSFSQSGQNGADYIIVVSDEVASSLAPYYSVLAVDILGDAPVGLQEKLDNVKNYYDEFGNFKSSMIWGFGTDQIISCSGVVLVQTNMLTDIKFILIAVAFPFIYIGLVFLCVSLTILSVQQISDSAKYKYRYAVLSKLGLKEREINLVILKQLAIYYLSPLAISILIGSVFSLYLSDKFIYYTSVNSLVFQYFGSSIFILLFVYILYFIATYVEFKNNIHR